MEAIGRRATETGLGSGRGWEIGFSNLGVLYKGFLIESHSS